jgi:putative transposase
MSNHLHVLLHLPERQEVTDEEWSRRLSFLYDSTMVATMADHIASLRAGGNHAAAEEIKAPYVKRMYSLAEFAKTLKQRVSFSYNRRHKRQGTFWEGRYKSVLVDGSPGALTAMAAYIDLNAVRAKIVSDPKDYRFCGYGEAMGGSKSARAGLIEVLGGGQTAETWALVCAQYRQLLYVTGEERGLREDGKPVRSGFSYEAVEAVLASKGRLPLNLVLRCRVRYFTDGAILGSREFVDRAFERHRAHFGKRRESGARTMRGAKWGDLFTARELRVDVLATPVPA